MGKWPVAVPALAHFKAKSETQRMLMVHSMYLKAFFMEAQLLNLSI